LNSNITKNVYGYRNLSTFGGLTGIVPLATIQTALGATIVAPVHVYDLTSANNIIGGSALNVSPRLNLSFTNETDTGNIAWISDVTTWQNENTQGGTTFTNSYPNGESKLKWINARFLFYAPTVNPTKISIEIVQLRDERLIPGAANTGNDLNFATAFWQYIAKKCMTNPIEPMNTKYRRYIKTLKTVEFILDPKETTESNATRYKEVNIFMRLNKTCRYDWQNKDRVNLLNQDPQQNYSQLSNYVHPRASVFMIVKGLATKSTGYTSTLHPTYDICLRTCHTQVGN